MTKIMFLMMKQLEIYRFVCYNSIKIKGEIFNESNMGFS